MMQIKVLNKNKTEIVDYFDGIAYKFPPNIAINIPAEVAQHIFGVVFPEDIETCNSDAFRATIFLNLQRRWGWNLHDIEKLAAAKESFNNIILAPVVFKLVEREPKLEEIAEPREQKISPKTGKFKPRVEIGTEEEEVA